LSALVVVLFITYFQLIFIDIYIYTYIVAFLFFDFIKI